MAAKHSTTVASGITPAAESGPPGPVHEHVERLPVDKLLDRAAQRRICVVIGAAGWGKTTAVAAWCRSRPTVWLRYEDHDGDPDRLRVSLFRALRRHIATNPDHMGTSVAALCLRLRNRLNEDLVLVLDDLHGLPPDSDAAGIVETLCQRAPDRLHLILISRHELPFSLQRLRGRGLVAEIYAPDLAFDIAEVDALLRKTVGAHPPGLSRRVWEHTGGWPTAVHHAAEMLRAVAGDQRLEVVGRLSHPRNLST